MKSKVYFSSIRNNKKVTPLIKIKKLMQNCGLENLFEKDDLIAIKIHFGEYGNTSFIRPIFIRPVIEELKNLGTKPFLTDTNTLYIGMRSNSIDHYHNAILNGFNYSTLQVPVIIADGLRGENTTSIEVNLEYCKKVKLASDLINADGMVAVSHFKAHEMSGFGGALKNIAMGGASRQGKLDMHSQTKPVVKQKDCIACGKCLTVCQVNAITIKEKAVITSKCVGCVRCAAVCPKEAIHILWNESSDNMQKKMVEYAYGVMKAMNNQAVYINFLTAMSPACDCYGFNDKPITEDIGYLASLDPVAIDKASYDLVTAQAQEDPFKKIYPNIDSGIQLNYAQKIGLGSVEYDLITIE